MLDHSEPSGAKVNVLNSCALFLVDATQHPGDRQQRSTPRPSSKQRSAASAGRGRGPVACPYPATAFQAPW